MCMQAVLPEALDTGSYLEIWLEHAKARVRLKTWERYAGMIHFHVIPALGDVALSELSAVGIQHFYTALMKKVSTGSTLNVHLVLRNALAQAVRWGYLGSNPADGAQPPRPRRKELVVVDPALAQLVLEKSSGSRYELPIAIALATGMRRGEILGLRWVDVSPDYLSLQVMRTLAATKDGWRFEEPKTRRSRRSVVLPSFLVPYLEVRKVDRDERREVLASNWHEYDMVCDQPNGEPWNPDFFSSGWAPFLRNRGLPHLRFHDLRHAHATMMLQQGVHPKIVSERLGHASIGITLDIYSHVLPSMQSEAADAIDRIFA